MYTIEELTFDKIRIRKSNPDRAAALGRIVDVAQKAAKQEKRSAEVADISKAAEKLTKEASKDIELFGASSSQADALRREIEIYKEFLPKKLDEAAIRELAIRSVANHCDAASTTNKDRKARVIRELKAVEGMDMQALLHVLDELFA